MKKLIALLMLLPLFSAAQQCIWAKKSTGGRSVVPNNIVTDASGNSYVTGYFDGSSLSFGSAMLMCADTDAANIYVVKYNPAGSVVWAKNFFDSLGIYAYSRFSIAINPAGTDIYLFGTFNNPTMTFGSTTLTNTHGNDNFLVKLDSSGSVLWAKSQQVSAMTTPDENQAIAVTTDPSGNAVVAGMFNTNITMGTTTLTNTSGSGLATFLAKYDPSGNVIWAKNSVASLNYSGPTAITTDPSGNIYMSGNYTSTTISFDAIILSNAEGTDLYLVKYSPTGTAIWAKTIGDSLMSDFRRLATDAAGNIYAGGEFFDNTITFGTTVLNNLAAGNGSNIFTVKYDPSGNVTWAKSAGGTSGDFGNALHVDAAGNSFIGGMITSMPATFGTHTLGNIGVFLAKYNPGGSLVWTKEGAALNAAGILSISGDNSGNVYAIGNFGVPFSLTFDTITLVSTSADGDMFIAKFKDLTESVEYVSPQNDLVVYPNPATNEIILSSTEKLTSVRITNQLGQTVQNIDCSTNKLSVDITRLPSGIYFINVNGLVRKVFKE